jgi:signal peptidase I
MRALPRNRLATAAAGVVVLAVVWTFLAPPQLGGSTSYAVIAGTSMEPHLHRGDLVLARGQGSYAVGDAVVYRSSDLGRSVLHRVIAREGPRFVFKGDNNTFVDPVRPEQHDLVGRLWIRVPRAGGWLEWLRAPLHAAILVGLAALLAFGRGVRPAETERRRPNRGDLDVATRLLERAGPARVALVGVLAVSAILAVLAFTRGAAAGPLGLGSWSQHGSYSYSARAPRGPVYPRGRVATGDTVFLRLADSVDLRFDYRFESALAHGLAGTASLRAIVRGDNGWSRSLRLARPHGFKGDQAVVRGRLDLARLRGLVDRVERMTGTTSGVYTVTLEPDVRVDGLVAGKRMHDAFSPQLTFSLDELHLQLQQPGSSGVAGAPPSDPLHPSQTAAAPVSARASVGPLPLALARALAVLGLLGSLAALVASSALGGGGEKDDDLEAIASRFGSLVVPVGKPRHTTEGWAIDVETFEALAKLAERYDRAILHQRGSWGDSYLVEDGGVAYRFTPQATPPELSGDELPAIAPTAL